MKESSENIASQPSIDWLRSATPPWKPWVSGLFGFIFGPVAAAIVSYVNLRRLGAPRKAALVLVFTLLGSVLWGALFYLFPDLEPGPIGKFIGNAVSPFLYPALQRREFTNWQEENPTAKPRSAWRAVAWGPVGAVLFIALAFLGSAPWFFTEIEGIELSFEFPNRIVAGEEFRFELEILNTADAPQLLKDMELDLAFLRQITVLGTEPGFKKSEVNPFSGMRIYTFDTPILPGEILRIEVRAMPKAAGEHHSDIGLCITYDTHCVYWDFTINVEGTDVVPAPELEGVWEAGDEGCTEIYTEKEVLEGIDEQPRREKRRTQLVFSGNSFFLNTVDCSDGSTRTHFRGTFVIGNKTTNKQGIVITEMDMTGKTEDGQQLAHYTSYYLKNNMFIQAMYAPGSANNGTSPEKRTRRIGLEDAGSVLLKR